MNGAIAAGHELTARAGADALARGGTAVDALVAAAAMSWAAEPALTGPCGGGFALVRPVRGRPALLDAFTSIPGINLPPRRRLGQVRRSSCPSTSAPPRCFTSARPRAPCPGWCRVCTPCTPATAGCRGGSAAAGRRRRRPRRRGQSGPVRRVQGDRGDRDLHGRGPGGVPARRRFLEVGDVVRQTDLAGSIERLAEAGRPSSPRAAWPRRWWPTKPPPAAA